LTTSGTRAHERKSTLPWLGWGAWQRGRSVTRSNRVDTKNEQARHDRVTDRDARAALAAGAAVAEGTFPAVREAMKALTGVIGWVGASIAGLTAACYGAGYFTIHEHLTMLGFGDVVDVSNDQLLLEGGRFFYLTLQQMAVGGMIIIVSVTAVCAIAWAIYRIPWVRKRKAAEWIRERLASKSVKSLTTELLPLFAVVIVVVHYNLYYAPTSSILGLENLAFAKPSGDEFAKGVGAMIQSGCTDDRDWLVGTYGFFCQVYALFIGVTWLIIYNRSSTAFGKAANLLFVLYTVILTAFLPLAFAVLVRTPIYPVVDVTLKAGQPAHGLVIQRTDRGILLWNPLTRHVVSYGSGDVAGYEVVGDQDIFARS